MKKVYKVTVTWIGAMICLGLTLLSAVYDCYMSDVWSSFHEITIFEKDHIWINLLALLFFVGVFWALAKRFSNVRISEISYEVIHYMLLAVIAAMGVFWVLSVKAVPREDQLFIQQSLEAFLNGDKAPFMPDGYIGIYPHQTGYMWFSLIVAKIFGLYNYTALQLINVAALVLFYESLTRLCDLFQFKKHVGIMILVAGILFYPLIIYTSFVYGNVLGLAFATASIWRAFCVDSDRSRPVLNYILSAVLMALAVQCKKNYLIFAIGLIIWLFVKACADKKKQTFIALAGIVLAVILGMRLPIALTEWRSGCKLDSGIPATAFIAMGLQESERAPGWYNEYTKDLTFSTEHDHKAQVQIAKQDIKESLNRFKSDPKYAFVFFLNKTKSQWSNPTFQSVWVNQFVGDTETQPKWVQSFLSFDNVMIHVRYLSILTFIIFFGALLYIPLSVREDRYTESLILLMIVIGGFIFHTFWEGKSEYTISYFVLLIPYCCAGYIRLAERLGKIYEQQGTDNT